MPAMQAMTLHTMIACSSAAHHNAATFTHAAIKERILGALHIFFYMRNYDDMLYYQWYYAPGYKMIDVIWTILRIHISAIPTMMISRHAIFFAHTPAAAILICRPPLREAIEKRISPYATKILRIYASEIIASHTFTDLRATCRTYLLHLSPPSPNRACCYIYDSAIYRLPRSSDDQRSVGERMIRHKCSW